MDLKIFMKSNETKSMFRYLRIEKEIDRQKKSILNQELKRLFWNFRLEFRQKVGF